MKLTRERLASVLLLAVGSLVFASGFLPWDHPRTHYREFWSAFEMVRDSARGGYLWDVSMLQLAGGALAFGIQMILALALILTALLPRGRLNLLSSIVFQGLFSALGALALCFYAADEFLAEGGSRNIASVYGAGALLVLVLLALQTLFFKRAWGSSSWGNAMHAPPLVVLGGGGFVAARALWSADHWHGLDYLVLGVAGLLGLVALAIRRATPE